MPSSPRPSASPASRSRSPAALRWTAWIHVAMAAALVSSPSRWQLWLATLFVNHAALFLAAVTPRSGILGPNLERLPTSGRHAGSPGRIALTFDDGPDPEVTPRILDILASHGATASFFLIGRRAERFPGVVRQIVSEGHAVHNHTWSHSPAFPVMPPSLVARELDRTDALLRELGAPSPRLLRAPAGVRPPWLEGLLARRGAWLTSWTRRGFDAVDRDVARIRARLLRDLSNGDILLLHDGRAARRTEPVGPLPASLEVLPGLLDELSRRGFETVGLSPAVVDEATDSL